MINHVLTIEHVRHKGDDDDDDDDDDDVIITHSSNKTLYKKLTNASSLFTIHPPPSLNYSGQCLHTRLYSTLAAAHLVAQRLPPVHGRAGDDDLTRSATTY